MPIDLSQPKVIDDVRDLLRHNVKYPATYMMFYWVDKKMGMWIDSNLDDPGIIATLKFILRNYERGVYSIPRDEVNKR